jgi:hypothetical protein
MTANKTSYVLHMCYNHMLFICHTWHQHSPHILHLASDEHIWKIICVTGNKTYMHGVWQMASDSSVPHITVKCTLYAEAILQSHIPKVMWHQFTPVWCGSVRPYHVDSHLPHSKSWIYGEPICVGNWSCDCMQYNHLPAEYFVPTISRTQTQYLGSQVLPTL